MRLILKSLVLILACLTGFVGYQFGLANSPVLFREIIREVEKPVNVILVVEKPIFVEVLKEVLVVEKVIEIKEIRYTPRWFNSLEELTTWYWMTQAVIVRWSFWDCDDWAIELQRQALEDGYLLPLAPVYMNRIFDTYLPFGFAEAHVGNWTLIGNDWYYVEPQPVKNPIIKIAKRD